MRRILLATLALGLFGSLLTAGSVMRQGNAVDEIAAVLDDFHAAASAADGDRYFDHFANDAVFLGTDDTERWDLASFKAFAAPYFDKGTGWTYHPIERHISVSPGNAVAWFDERLMNEKLGVCRGSGVLVRERDAWRIAQYNLTIPIPNDLADDVTGMIRDLGTPKVPADQ